MVYRIEHEHFSGPLDLLLQLIEGEKLDITKISLARVADEYLHSIQQTERISPEEMADFLVVAARLILLKSKSLLPNLDLAEEGDLETQLKLYKEFLEASKKIEAMIRKKKFSCSREKLPMGIEPEFNPPKGLTSAKLAGLFTLVIQRLEPLIKLPEETLKRVINIEERIRHIKEYITEKVRATFHQLVGGGDKVDRIVSFLALLELMKQRTLLMDQDELFGEIMIKKV
ncbi:segregation/condensation protein A [Candidatus Falkowbacteria bacterium]|nr:segregation/condensation protein A [Candidatus Falkowbacteria bacterium]